MVHPSLGSAGAVQEFARSHPGVPQATLQWYDAAVAARHITIPVHCACALEDPAVPPVGQFAIYKALAGPKQLFVLDAGHQAYPGQTRQERLLWDELLTFFGS